MAPPPPMLPRRRRAEKTPRPPTPTPERRAGNAFVTLSALKHRWVLRVLAAWMLHDDAAPKPNHDTEPACSAPQRHSLGTSLPRRDLRRTPR
jgi:hypothetical protein